MVGWWADGASADPSAYRGHVADAPLADGRDDWHEQGRKAYIAGDIVRGLHPRDRSAVDSVRNPHADDHGFGCDNSRIARSDRGPQASCDAIEAGLAASVDGWRDGNGRRWRS